MTTVEYRGGNVKLELIGDAHIRVDLHNRTHISLKGCQIAHIWPAGKYTLEQLKRLPIASLYPDQQPGRVFVHTADLPKGWEDDMSVVNIPEDVSQDTEMPINPD